MVYRWSIRSRLERRRGAVPGDIRPDAVLILGDTNSCLAAIAAKRRRIPVFHMEAGCFDEHVPEEINRRIVDHIADINLPYSDPSRVSLSAPWHITTPLCVIMLTLDAGGVTMIRTQIQLRDDQAEQLRDLAAQEGISMAELVRQGVDRLLREASGTRRSGTRLDALTVAGRFDSGMPGIARHHDDELADAYLGAPPPEARSCRL
jgi:hypothetical protein